MCSMLVQEFDCEKEAHSRCSLPPSIHASSVAGHLIVLSECLVALGQALLHKSRVRSDGRHETAAGEAEEEHLETPDPDDQRGVRSVSALIAQVGSSDYASSGSEGEL